MSRNTVITDEVLEEMLALIDNGFDITEAAYRICVRHNVDEAAVMAAYDKHDIYEF